MAKIDADLYQWIYKNIDGYGQANKSHCPGIRVYPYYRDWLKSPIIDLGSGTGDTVNFFIKNKFTAKGVDYIEPQNSECVKGDISLSMDLKKYQTATCFDVIEHLNNAQVKGLFLNMVQCDRQIFTIANTPSCIEKEGKKIDLHINKKSFAVWRGIIQEYFDIYYEFTIRDYQHLFLCEKKKGLNALIDFIEKQGYIVHKQDD